MAAPGREGSDRDGEAAEVSDRRDSPAEADPSEGSGWSDVDLLVDRVDVERNIGRWIRALDQHMIGACRDDERMNPLLKLDISTGVVEDRFMAQLSQHFEAAEVGLLARCLCVPLVSIRVGKVNKHGNVLSPTATRGHLNLTLLPSSNMRISFTGDDGLTESLAVLSNDFESSQVIIEEILADSSGRSFLLKLPGIDVSYFWCSEKLKMHGMHLLTKMKDLLRRKPSLSHLTGICESRLNSFAIHLRAYLLRSSNASEVDPSASLGDSLMTASSMDASETEVNSHSIVSNSPWRRFTASHTTKTASFNQIAITPRPDAFEDGTARSSSSISSCITGKVNKCEDNSHSSLSSNYKLATAVSTSSGQSSDVNVMGSDVCSLSSFISQPEISCPLSNQIPSIPLLLNLPPLQIGTSRSLFSPYYCWCPPCPSSRQYSLAPHQPISFDESLPLPPLSSLLSASATGPPVSLVASNLPGGAAETPSLNLSPFLPEAFVPHPVSSLISMPPSKQIPIFTPYMSDPIVHIPMIDICSSGQGYLVSAGSSMSSAIPSLLPSFASHPLIQSTESPLENSARETLRMLMASTPSSTSPNMMNVLPVVFNRINENFHCAPASKHVPAAAECQGLLFGTLNTESVKMGLCSRAKVDNSGDDKFRLDERENHSVAEDSSLPGSQGFGHTEDTL